MGLFSNKDKPCPICGGATPRLLAKKIEGQPICGNCADQIMADDDQVKSWTMEQLKEHLRYREENLQTVRSFTPTRTVDFDREAFIDDNRHLFYINQWGEENPPVFRFEDILGFTIERGFQTVESWSRGMPRSPYQPPESGILGGLAALADIFDDDDDKDTEYSDLKVTLQVNTPYLRQYEVCSFSVSGRGQAAYAADFAREMSKVNTICNLFVSLASGQMASGSAAAPSAPTTPPAEQTADSILKFKELLDAGIITQEEFNAKKKQLLGI